MLHSLLKGYTIYASLCALSDMSSTTVNKEKRGRIEIFIKVVTVSLKYLLPVISSNIYKQTDCNQEILNEIHFVNV